MFGFTITRDEDVDASGLAESEIQSIEDVVVAALEYWGRYIDAPNANIEISLSFASLGGPVLASAGPLYASFGGGPFFDVVNEELSSNTDSGPFDEDANLNINLDRILDGSFFLDTTYEPNPVGIGPGQSDLLTVLTHEVGHILGFIGSFPGVETLFSANSEQIGDDFFFVGANAVAANGGQNIQVDGSVFGAEGHIFGIGDLLSSALVEGVRLPITPIHVGVLQDLGVSVVETSSGDDVLHGFEEYNDFINGLDGDDVIFGHSGDDELRAGNGNDVLNGNIGEDSLFGQNGADTINGGEGNDTAFGGAGDDALNGEAGDDVLTGQSGNDMIFGGAGNDTLNGNSGDDVIDGGLGVDIINGGGGADDINGGDGNDTLSGAIGEDVILGADGDDLIFGNNQNDMLFGNGGVDTLNGGGGNDTLDGGGGADILIGGAGRDELLGQGGSDNLSGGSGGDSLIGGTGNDIINGGGGNDILNGGAGADQFILDLGFGTDRLQDFEDGVDLIDVSGNVLADDFADVLAAATQVGGNIRIELNANNTLIIENFNLDDLDATDFIF